MKKQNLNDLILFQLDKTNKMAKQYSQCEFDRLKLDITVDQWVLLKIIEENGPLSQRELAALSVRDPASITRTLDLMEKKSWINRESIPGNRRQYNIQLSEDGKKFVKTNMKMIKKHRLKSTNGFNKEELELLKNMLKKIQDNML